MKKAKTEIQLSDHFTYKKLIQFTFPPIAMMIFTSIYGVVDGYFVSNFAGKTPFAALNLIWPYVMVMGCIGFMFGSLINVRNTSKIEQNKVYQQYQQEDET